MRTSFLPQAFSVVTRMLAAVLARPLILLALIFGFAGFFPSAAAQTVFPDKTWVVRTPAQAGMDDAKLAAFAQRVGGDGVIIKDGYLVKSWGKADKREDWASAAKPVLSTLLLLAVDDNLLASADALVKDAGWTLTPKDSSMTWWHLANMVSGYACVEKPGAAWAYNDFAIQLYARSLERVFGSKLDAAIRERLAPLKFEDGAIFGSRNGLGVVASPRDFARIGWLWLNEGQWKGQSIITQKLFTDHIKPQVPASLPRTKGKSDDYLGIGSYGGPTDQTPHGPGVYGFNFWFNNSVGDTATRAWPALPADAYQANGMWNRDTVTIIPSLRIVVAVRGAKLGAFEPGKADGAANQNLKLIVDACAAADSTVFPPTRTRRVGPAADKPRRPTNVLTCAGGPALALLAGPALQEKELGHVGAFAQWRRVELSLTGPDSESSGEPNPFELVLNGVFTAPSGKQWTVPGFFDGDGKGQPDGAAWKVRFSADEPGDWTFVSRSPNAALDGWTAQLTVTPASSDATGVYRWGRLEAVGTAENKIRYLKFRDGPYWLKAGCDDPENFLGKYRNYDTNLKRIAAIDYLADRGINSLYIMTHNLDGDDKDVWPWLGQTQKEAKANSGSHAKFDTVRLNEWLEVFEHMQAKGMVTYIVLEDDSAWKGFDHARYYREIVARFGHLPALVFNMGEEHNENYKLSEGLALAQQLAEIDPYDHPRGIHNVNTPNDAYIDAPQIDFTAIQTGNPDKRSGLEHALQHNQLAIDWIRRCESRGKRTLMVNFDEGRPEEQRAAWWAAYLAGGVWEAHVLPPYDRPMSAWETTWNELGGARAFMESLPFWEMQPHNALVTSGEALCLAKLGEVYALYLPNGGQVTLELPASGEYQFDWWNPANGIRAKFADGGRVAKGQRTFTAPTPGDWALRVMRSKP